MRIELASATLRRARAAAMRRSLQDLVDRLTPLVPSGNWLARPRQTSRNPGFINTQRCPS